MSFLLLIILLILFIIADYFIRQFLKNLEVKKALKYRQEALDIGLNIDVSHEAKTLKRVTVDNPKARILAVDDEEVILDSFRKILVLDGFSVDTVQTGQEVLGLIQKHDYDFVFTDLKMPEMDGLDVTKGVKHLRPDIDVVIITGYATVETAVEGMKFGSMDYVQKPFTEDELRDFAQKLLIRRQDRLDKRLKPHVQVTHTSDVKEIRNDGFTIPGGVFISPHHCWVSIDQAGNCKVGIDDFANKLIGQVDKVEFPDVGDKIKKDDPVFTLKQGRRAIAFRAPVSGEIIQLNDALMSHPGLLEKTPYMDNWVCIIKTEHLEADLAEMKIGEAAVSYYREQIDKFSELAQKLDLAKDSENAPGLLFKGELQKVSDADWKMVVETFF